MTSKTIIITGGTGLVRTALTRHLLANGHKIIILSRNPQKAAAASSKKEGVQFAQWDVKAKTIDEQVIKEADAIIHLAGAGVVDKPWTSAYKKEIVDSRVQSAALLVKATREIPNKIETVVSASAIGWYGSDKAGAIPFMETSPAAPGFRSAPRSRTS